MNEFVNWSGGVRFTPGQRATPEDERGVAEILQRAVGSGRHVRAVGAGHSSSPLVETDGVLVSLERFNRLEHADPDLCRARLGAGTTINQTSRELLDVGLAMENTGDIDRQTLAGGFATGTHGTGARLGNLPTQLIGIRLVTASGEPLEISGGDLLRAARVSLGAFGIVTAVTMRLVPAFRLHRIERCMPLRECLDNLDGLIAGNRNFDFYWYPRRDDVKIRTMNPVTDDRSDIEIVDGSYEEIVGWSGAVLPRVRELRFHEMEYAVPAEAGPECFAEVRRRVRERHLKTVAWRVLYRTVAADDALLSPAQGRATVTISLHQNQSLPYLGFFTDIEPIFQAYDGRPHWGKVHTLRGEGLLSRYPDAERWLRIRRELDPSGIFLTRYLSGLLGESP